MDRVLVPVDGSELACAALDYAAELASRTGAELVVFSVVDDGLRQSLEEFAKYENISVTEAAQAYLGRMRRRALDIADVPVSEHFVWDSHPAQRILDFVEEDGVAVVVMSTHGRSGLSRWLLGSVTEKVVQACPVPVLVVPVRHERAAA